MNSRISLFFKGMLMGVAEIIPGVSGGTLAFITGIYNELINSINKIKAQKVLETCKRQFSIDVSARNDYFNSIIFKNNFISFN